MERKKSYRKITGRWRRILSSMLVLAMILSSVPTTGAVYAAKLPSESLIDAGQTASTEPDTEESLETESVQSTETDTVENTETVSVENAETEGLDEDSVESLEAESVESTAVIPEEEAEDKIDVQTAVSDTEVMFRYYDAGGSASTVNVAGSFNDWSTTAFSLTEEDNVFYGKIFFSDYIYIVIYKYSGIYNIASG